MLVCENPTVVAAVADCCGAATPPLVCTDGQPSGAVQALLGQLVEADAALDFHVDFDGGGIRIGNRSTGSGPCPGRWAEPTTSWSRG